MELKKKQPNTKIMVKKIQRQKIDHLYKNKEITSENFDWKSLEQFAGGPNPLHRLLVMRDFKRIIQAINAIKEQGKLTEVINCQDH